MKAKETRDYLEKAFKLEQSIYTMEEGIDKLKSKSSILAKPREVEPLQRMDYPEETSLGSIILFLLFNPVTGIILVILFLSSCGSIQVLLWGSLGFVVLLAIVAAILKGICHSGEKYKSDKIREENVKLRQEYQIRLDKEKLRMEKETLQKAQINQDIKILEKQREECETVLEELYSLDVIHAKYRNFVAVGMLYEYFDTERCQTLGGHEGAYNVYESEVRMNLIISKLDDVVEQLHDIKENQFAMYNAIKMSQEQTEKIYQNSMKNVQLINEQNVKLQKLTDNSSLIAYNSKLAAENSQTLKYITLYKERLKGDIPYEVLNFIE